MRDETDNVVELTAWQETTGLAAQHGRRSLSSTAVATSLTPISDSQADRARFAQALTPCLSLVAPTGMTQAERSEWLHAAFLALRHLPADVIEKGAQSAIANADHPSKIVPAIAKAVEDDMAWRRRMNSSPIAHTPMLSESFKGPSMSPEECADILRKAGVGHMALKTNLDGDVG